MSESTTWSATRWLWENSEDYAISYSFTWNAPRIVQNFRFARSQLASFPALFSLPPLNSMSLKIFSNYRSCRFEMDIKREGRRWLSGILVPRIPEILFTGYIGINALQRWRQLSVRRRDLSALLFGDCSTSCAPCAKRNWFPSSFCLIQTTKRFHLFLSLPSTTDYLCENIFVLELKWSWVRWKSDMLLSHIYAQDLPRLHVLLLLLLICWASFVKSYYRSVNCCNTIDISHKAPLSNKPFMRTSVWQTLQLNARITITWECSSPNSSCGNFGLWG